MQGHRPSSFSLFIWHTHTIHRITPLQPLPFFTQSLARPVFLPNARDTKGVRRAEQGRPVQGQVEQSQLQAEWVKGARQAVRHHPFVWGFMFTERNRKREREREHYKHILER